MKREHLRELDIAALCRELALLLHAGVGEGDALSLLAEEDTPHRALLADLARRADAGASLAEAMAAADVFPAYVTGLVRVGHQAGRTEEALGALAVYYESRDRLNRRLRESLLYPAILLVLMLVVIVVLLTRVLPVFEEVYASLGGQLTGLAGGLLALGRVLDGMLPVLAVLLAAVVVFLAAFSGSDGCRDQVLALWQRLWGDRGVSRQLHDARFAQALAMGVGSGLAPEEALSLAGELLGAGKAALRRAADCCARLEWGEDLPTALRESGMLPPAACRMLALGFRSGSGDAVLEEVACRLSREVDLALERQTARVEPALVLTASLLVGAILLAVMLPLLHIMQSIG